MNRFTATRILLVEDNLDDIEITRRALKKCRVANTLQVVRDGREALDYLLRKGVYVDRMTPDLILLDVNLPKLNGMEVLARVRAMEDQSLSKVPIIMLTASGDEEDIAKAYSFGTNAYVQKPVDFERFAAALANLAEFWVVIARLPRAA